MNLFEKIFNHQILSRLEDSGTFMVTSHERAWLKTMLALPSAADAFTPDTLGKLHLALAAEEKMDTSTHLIEKARSQERQVYHPLLRPLRRLIMNRTAMSLSYGNKKGTAHSDQPGFPYKLEFSMVKREWYLLWYHMRLRTFMSTRLKNIHSLSPVQIDSEQAQRLIKKVESMLEARKREVLIEILPAYNQELSRILYSFSSFEKQVAYEAEQDTYRVKVTLIGDELEYLLSKIRFLGKRVRVVDDGYMKQRMLESSAKALERYGVVAGQEETCDADADHREGTQADALAQG